METKDPQTLVQEILDSGMTQIQLASAVPCSQGAISFIATGQRGKNISKRIGDRIEQIHRERCGVDRRKPKATPP